MKILRCFDCQLTVCSIWVPYFRHYTAGFPKRCNGKDRSIGITIERSPHINNKSLEMTTCKTQCHVESSFDFGKGHWLQSQLVTFYGTLLIAYFNSASDTYNSTSSVDISKNIHTYCMFRAPKPPLWSWTTLARAEGLVRFSF